MIAFLIVTGIVFINLFMMLAFRSVEPHKPYMAIEREAKRAEASSVFDLIFRRAQ